MDEKYEMRGNCPRNAVEQTASQNIDHVRRKTVFSEKWLK